jgi:hypothetical protein
MLCVHSSTHRLLVASFLSHTHQSPINRLRLPLRLSSDWKVVDNPIFAQAMSAVASLILAQGCFSIASEMKDLPFSLDLPRNHYHWFDYSLLLQFIYYYCKYYRRVVATFKSTCLADPYLLCDIFISHSFPTSTSNQLSKRYPVANSRTARPLGSLTVHQKMRDVSFLTNNSTSTSVTT